MIYALFLVAYLIAAGIQFAKHKEMYLSNKVWALTAFLVDIGCWMFVAYFITAIINM